MKVAALKGPAHDFEQAVPAVTGSHVRLKPLGQDQHSPPLRGSEKLPLGQPVVPVLVATWTSSVTAFQQASLLDMGDTLRM